MARAAIDYAVETVKNRMEIPSGRPMRNSGRIQSVIGAAEMLLGAARSYVFVAMEREWARLDSNEQPTVRERTDSWLSRVNAAQAAREIVRMLYDALGSASIYSERSPLDRALRDAETVCQHIVMQQKTLAMAGAMLLEADTPVLPYI
jgi:alkylation response protein AidB-like acyl-CoA dehydrogenase